MNESRGQLEVERSFDIAPGIALPDFAAHPLISHVTSPEVDQLVARYFDTPDLTLGRRGSALRYRSGGHDAGWHLKTRVDRGHEELHWALPFTPGSPLPEEILSHLAQLSVDGEFTVIASITTERTTRRLTRAGFGTPEVEVADDLVRSVDERTGRTRSWREWEIELLEPLDPDEATVLLDALEAALLEVGASPSTAASKLHRALGLDEQHPD